MRIRFRIQLINFDADEDPDADPGYQNYADPCESESGSGYGSGSTTLDLTSLLFMIFCVGVTPPSDPTTGIIVIAVVCCVLGTSLVWVFIIYHTRCEQSCGNVPN
jgi:hypothetical protein